VVFIGGQVEAELKILQKKVDQWRRNGRIGGRVPEELWALAVRLAHKVGSALVVKVTGLHGASLRKRLEGLERGAELPVQSESVTSTFVEFLAGESPEVPPSKCNNTTVEVESRGGERMRIQASNLGGSDLSLLLREFLAR
jgi:hypothetical protein